MIIKSISMGFSIMATRLDCLMPMDFGESICWSTSGLVKMAALRLAWR